MYFWLRDPGTRFQWLLERALAENCFVNIDDIIVFSSNQKQLLRDLDAPKAPLDWKAAYFEYQKVPFLRQLNGHMYDKLFFSR